MINKIKYLFSAMIFLSLVLWGITLYIESNIQKEVYVDSLKTIENNVIETYKESLKNDVDNTIKFIDIYYKSISDYYYRLINSKAYSFYARFQNNSIKATKNYLSHYTDEDIVKITFSKPQNNILLQKKIELKNLNFYMYIENDVIKKRILSKLRKRLYDVDDINKKYMWISEVLDYNGGTRYAKRLIHPNLKHTEDSLLSTEARDKRGNKPYLTELNSIKKNKEVFFTYFFKELESNKISEKLTFSKLYERYNWIISTGIPLNKLEVIINQKKNEYSKSFDRAFKKIIIFSLVSLLLFFFVLVYLYNKVIKYIRNNILLEQKLYKNKIDFKYQKNLEKKEKEYRELFYENNSIILVIDPINFKIVNINQAAQNFYGYSKEEFTELRISDINVFKNNKIKKVITESLLKNKKEFITKHILKNKEIVHVKIFATATKYNDRKVLYCIVQNITEEIKAKKDLRQTVKELQKIKNNLDFAQKISHIGSWEYDKQKSSFYCSKEVYHILNINERQNPTLKLLLNYVYLLDRDKVKRIFYDSKKNKKVFKVTHRLLLDNNEMKYVEEYGEHIFDSSNKYQKTIGTIYDVTKTKFLESSWENFFKLSLNLVLVIDFELNILKINPACQEVLGYNLDELIGKSLKDLIHPLDKTTSVIEFEAIKKGKKTFSYENRLIRKDMKFINLNWSIVAVPENGIIYAIAQDITDLKNKNYLLSQQSKMAAMGEMLGNIAHQWRQPLSMISTLATGSKIQKDMNALSDEDFINSMDTINSTAQFLSETIDDFRSFFDKNKEETEFYTSDLVDKTIKLISAQFINHGIEIVKNIEDVKLHGLENELVQVLINILNNARDALIEKRENQRFIFIDIKKVSEYKLQISIKDNAYGIKEEIIDKIFEPYFTTKHAKQGTGIGLYMSAQIIDKHMNGSITVKNTQYKFKDNNFEGAEFKIELNL